jgi:hypothetical protein
MRWAGHVASTGETRNVYNILAVKSEGRMPFDGSKHIQEGNIKMYPRDIRYVDTFIWR